MRKGNRLFYMFAETPADDPKSIPRTQVMDYQKEARKGKGSLRYIWAKDADHARKMLKGGKGEKFSGIFNLSGNRARRQSDIEARQQEFEFIKKPEIREVKTEEKHKTTTRQYRESEKTALLRPNFQSYEPWQMTAYEWETAKDYAHPETVQSRVTKSSGSEMARKIAESQRLNYGVKQVYDPDIEWYSPVTHKDIILKAIDEGKAIHPIVMEDYPEFKKEVQPPQPEEKIPAYMTEKPFTQEQLNEARRFSHYTIDFNKQFSDDINKMSEQTLSELKKFGYNDMPAQAQQGLIEYRKALYNYFLTSWRLVSYYPGAHIVGASKYPFKRRETYSNRASANSDRLQQAYATFEKVIKNLKTNADPKFMQMKRLGTAIEYLPDAIKMDRLNFGKLMVEKFREKKPGVQYNAEFIREKGRELHEELVSIAIERGEKINYQAVKDYPKLIGAARAKNLFQDEPETKAIKQIEYKLNQDAIKLYKKYIVEEKKNTPVEKMAITYIGLEPQAEYDNFISEIFTEMDNKLKNAGFAELTPEAIKEFEKFKKAYADYYNQAIVLTVSSRNYPDSLKYGLQDLKHKVSLKWDRFKNITDAILKSKQGTMGDIPQAMTAKDVSQVLGNQPLNKGIPESELSEKWIASSTFHKMSVPVEIIGTATEPMPGALPVTQGPIIVDLNINELGRIKSEFGTHGRPPDILVLDGKHRLTLAKKSGQRVIEAFVGDAAIPIAEKAYKKFEAKSREMKQAIDTFVKNPNGSTLLEVKVNFPKSEVESIREMRKAGKSSEEIKHNLNLGYSGAREVRNMYATFKDAITQAVVLAARNRKKQYIPYQYSGRKSRGQIHIHESKPMYDNYYEISPNATVKLFTEYIDGWRSENVPLDFYDMQRIRERIERIELPEPEDTGIQPAFFGDLAGAQANCAVWQEIETPEKDSIFRCLLYAPACQLAKAKCVDETSNIRSCVQTQKVESTFYKKLITRCKKYLPACKGKNCLPAPMEKPPREYPRRSEIISYAKFLAEEQSEIQETAGKTLAREILSRGGIAPYKGGHEKEEYKGIPLVLKNKGGMPLDEMASEMRIDEAELMRQIHVEYPTGVKKKRKFDWKEYFDVARDTLINMKAMELK